MLFSPVRQPVGRIVSYPRTSTTMPFVLWIHREPMGGRWVGVVMGAPIGVRSRIVGGLGEVFGWVRPCTGVPCRTVGAFSQLPCIFSAVPLVSVSA